MFKFKHNSLLLVFIIAIGSAGSVLFTTTWGIGTSPDSVAYIGSARNLAAGLGLTIPFWGLDNAPMTHHAPFYPAFLGAIGFSGIDPAHVARISGAVIIAVNVFLAAWLVSRMVAGMNWPPVFAALLVGISPTILEIHSMAWTEPLFISLGFLGLGLLARGLENRSWKLSLIAALLVGLAALTRYAGVALIFSGILGILLLARVGVIHRLTYAAGFGMAAGLPLLVWVAYNILTVGTATSRSLNFHPIGRGQLWQGMASITSWLLIPENAPTWFHLATLTLLGLLISAALFIIWRCRNKEWTTPGITLSLISLFIPVYILFLVVSISLFDANTPLDGRILSPAFFAGVVCLVALLSWVKIQNLQRFWRAGLALLFIFLAFGYGRASFEWVQTSSQHGIGFSAVAWKSSPILTTMQNIPSETLVYTNIPEGVYFNGQHRSLRLPIYYEAVRQQVNPDFEAEIEYAKQRLASGQVVVLFFTQLGRQENPSEGELVHRLGLELLAAQPDGNLYISNVSTGQLLP